MNNKALALVADTDIASTVGVGGATRSFAKGGLVKGRKKTKKEASYVNGPVTKDPCKACSMFRSGSCTLVMGTISPNGHCRFFAPKVKGYQEGGLVEDEEGSDEDSQPDIPTGNEDSDLAAKKEVPEAPEEVPPQSSVRKLSPEEVQAKGLDPNGPPEQTQERKDVRRLTPEEIQAKGLNPNGPDTGVKGQLQTFGEHAAQGALPLIGSLPFMVEGAKLGAVVGAPAGPIGAGLGGLAGAAIGGGVAAYGLRGLQDYIAEKLGIINQPMQEARSEANPYSAMAGELAPAAATFKVGPIAGSLGTRLVSGAGLGAIEAGQEAVTQQELDPKQIALAAAQGAVFPYMRKWAEPIANVGDRFRTRPTEIQQAALETPLRQLPPPPPEPETPPGGGPEPPSGGTRHQNYGGPEAIAANDNAGGLQTRPGRPDFTPTDTVEPSQPDNDNVLPKTRESIAVDKQDAAQSEPLKVSRGQAPAQPPPIPKPPSEPEAYTIERDGGNKGIFKKDTTPEIETPTAAPLDDNGIAPDLKGALTEQPIQETPAPQPPVHPALEKRAQDLTATPKREDVKPETFTGPLHQDVANHPEHQAAYQLAHQDIRAGIERDYPGDKKYGYAYDRGRNDARRALQEAKQAPEQRGNEVHAVNIDSGGIKQTTGDLLKLRTPVAKDFPGAKFIEGTRISGARAGKPKAEQKTSVPIHPAKQEPTKPEPAKPRILEDVNRGEIWRQAVERLRELRDSDRENREYPAWLHEMETEGNDELARQFLQAEKAPVKGAPADERPHNILDRQASSPTEAKRHNVHIQAQNEAMESFHKTYKSGYIPKPNERAKYIDDLRKAYSSVADKTKNAGEPYLAVPRSPAQTWLAAAKHLLDMKRPVPKSFENFVDADLHLRSKEGAEEVRATNRVEGDIRFNKRNITGHEEEHALQDTEIPIEHEDFTVVDPDDTSKYIEPNPLEAEDFKRWQEEHNLAENLNRTEHRVMGEATHNPMTGPPKERQQKAEGLAEKLASINVDKLAAQRTARKARDESRPLKDNELGSFWNDERGSIDIDKIRDIFVGSKDAFNKWYDDAIGKYVTPARSGKLGSHTRKLGHYSEATLAQAMSLANRTGLHYARLIDAHYKQFTKMSNADNWDFLTKFENNQPQSNRFLQATDAFFRRVLEHQFKLEKSFGSQAEWRENYLPHLFKNKGDFEKFDRMMQDKYGPTWFQKVRMFDTLAEARAAGYELKTNNPAELVSQRLMAGVSMVSKMWALQKLNDMGLAHPIKEAPHSVKGNPDWMILNAPDRQQWVIAPEAKQMWKNAMDKDALWQGEHLLGSAFRTWMRAKSIWVPIKLSLSGFHLLHTAHIHMNAGLADGWMFNGEKHKVTGIPTNPAEAAKAFKGALLGGARNLGQVFTYPAGAANRSFVEPMLKRADTWAKSHGSNAFEPMFKASENFSKQFEGLRVLDAFNNPDIAKTLTPEGRQAINILHEMGMSLNPGADYDIKSNQAFQQALGQGGLTAVKGAGAHTAELIQKLNPLQHFLFGTLIPMWKASQAMQIASARLHQSPELAHNEELRRVAFRKLGKNLDERYGEVFYPAQLWGKVFKNIGQASFLSMGWNVGFANTLAGSVTDNVRSAGILLGMLPKRSVTEQAIHDSSNKLAYVASYAATSMLMTAALSYYLSGKEPEGLDYVFPRAGGENPDGSPRRYTTMSFTREPVMFTKHSEAEGGPIGGAMKMLWSKMVFAPFVQAASNRDFFNREMSDPDASYFTQLGQRALGMSKDLLNPISFESQKQVERSGGTARDKAMAYAGFGPAAAYISKKDIQNKIAHDYYEGPGAGVKPYQDKETAEKRLDLRADRQQAIKAGDEAAAEKAVQGLVDTGLKRKSVEKEQYGKQDVYQFSRLDPTKKVGLVKSMDDADFKKYVLDSMSKNDKRRVENGGEPLDRTHARMLSEWQRAGHKIPKLEF